MDTYQPAMNLRDSRDRFREVYVRTFAKFGGMQEVREVFAIADRIHIHRLGRRAAVVSPKTTMMNDVVAVMTGALQSDAVVSALLDPRSREAA